ncbi:hypothetical protein BJG89_03920 [Staphylococcus nepalensis]|nr:hypothetical protein BJD96_03575 [Staphylococcus nepalensis]ATH64577.1 hypothetical protein BJG89_03920 [Staphylococcus nepalensis]
MRIIILGLLLLVNLIFVIQAFGTSFSISYLSLRIILAAFTFLLSVYLLLLSGKNKLATSLTILTLMVSLIHVIVIAHSIYIYIY